MEWANPGTPGFGRERGTAACGDAALRACRLMRSVASRLSQTLKIRWRETLFHTIELHHPFSGRAATVAHETDAKARRAGTERKLWRGCPGRGAAAALSLTFRGGWLLPRPRGGAG